MNEEETFLRAICDHPDEDTPRLAFADWLTEQGGALNTAWANGIRSQVWLARGETDVVIAQQSRVFESSYGRNKLHKRLGVQDCHLGQWERGFPTYATGNFGELRDQWPRLAFRLPIRILCVYEASEANAAELATWPALSLLKELEFSVERKVPLPADVLPILADCAEFQNLKTLKVWSIVSEAGVTALLDSPYLEELAALQLAATMTSIAALSQALQDRVFARFGQGVFVESPF